MDSALTRQQVKALCEDYINGALVSQLRSQYDLTYQRFDAILKDNEVPRRALGEAKRILSIEIEEEVAKRYTRGESIRALAIAYNVDRSVVKRVLSQHNVKKRSVHEENRKKNIDRDGVCRTYLTGKSASSTGRIYGITCLTVTRILSEAGIPIRFAGEKPKGKKSPLTEEQLRLGVELYEGGMSLTATIRALGSRTSTKQFSSMLSSRGVVLRSISEQNTVHRCNESYFKQPLTAKAAYLLGWLYTDGYIREDVKKYISMELHEQDSAVVQYMRDELCPTKPIYETDKQTRIFTTHCKAIHADLVALGLHQGKSLTLEYPEWMTDELFPHFLRGVIEGDGFISCNGPRFSLSFCGSSPFIKRLAQEVSSRYEIHLSTSVSMGNHVFITSGRDGALILAAAIYKEATMICPRKFLAFAKRTADIPSNPRIAPELVERCKAVVADCCDRFAEIL